jgi:anaerobic magnesium-protoporphyrin IX monomethyl ester cyclase
MKVTFINPPWYFKKELLFISQNLGIGYLASYIKKYGHDAYLVDALLDGKHNAVLVKTKYQEVYRYGLPYEEIAKRIPKDTDFIGISVPFTDLATITKEMSAVIKESHPDIPIICGGVYPSNLVDDEVVENVDYIVRGEGEAKLVKIISGEETINDNTDVFPDYDIRPIKEYIKWSPRGERKKKTLSMLTSRGCPFDCNFCSIHPIYGYKWRARSSENVLEEIEYVIKRFGVEHIEFEDDNLTLKSERAMRIFEGIKKHSITWSTPNGVRIDTLNYDMIKNMKASGCTSLCLAAEHGDPEMLKLMNKNLDLGKVVKVVEWCVELKIPTNVFFIIGYPGETEERFNNLVSFARKLRKIGIDNISVFLAKPHPNTRLHKLCKERGYLVHEDTENVLALTQYANYRKDYIPIVTEDFDRDEIWRRYQYFQNADWVSIRYNLFKDSDDI